MRVLFAALAATAFAAAPALAMNADIASTLPRASPPFELADIQLQGLRRVSAGTVFNLLPASVGDTVDSADLRDLTRALFKSGYFDDITLLRDGDTLIVRLAERPAIESIELSGNKAIKSEDLLESLGEAGLREGEIFKQATLERIGTELPAPTSPRGATALPSSLPSTSCRAIAWT